MAIFRVKNTFLRKEDLTQMARAKRHYLPGHVWHIPVKYAPHLTG